MLFNGGMIPTYLLVNNLHMTDTVWPLILPGCINVFNMLLVLSFFRQLPDELEEAAAIEDVYKRQPWFPTWYSKDLTRRLSVKQPCRSAVM